MRLLPFVLPPLLGAVIGYVTNALAIRMLFRPLEEKRVLGVRVPLTPGIIPRQRAQLAHSIARMVSTKLLTEDILLARLHEEEFAASLRTTVGRFTNDLLYGRGDKDKPGGLPDDARDGVAEVLEQLVSSFLGSTGFSAFVHRIVDAVVKGALEGSVDRVLPDDERIRLFAERAIVALSQGPAYERTSAAVSRWLQGHLEADTPVVSLVGERSISRLSLIVPGVYEPVLQALLSFLRRESTREQLSVHGRELLGRILKRLNIFQRFLVSATQYDRNLRETMPAIVDDLIESVARAGRNAENRERIILALQEKVVELGGTGVRSLLTRFDLQADDLLERLFAIGIGLLARPDVRDRIADALVRLANQHRDEDVGTFLETLLGTPADQLRERLVEVADRWISKPENQARVAERIVAFVRSRLGQADRGALGELVPMSEAQKDRIDYFLTARLLALVSRRVPEIIAGLDVYTMVVNKINALDMESVEQLLLMVIARHLKWINLFGALLGSLIGGIQVFVSLSM